MKITDQNLENPLTLIFSVGAVKNKEYAFPGSVFISEKDFKDMYKNTLKRYRKKETLKEAKKLTNRMFDIYSVKITPALKPGFCLVDTGQIERSFKELKGASNEKC